MTSHDAITIPPVAPPRADRAIGADEVERLRSLLVPEPGVDLSPVAWAPAPLPLGEGWDNTIWDVGSMPDGTPLALRVARREVAVELLDHEVLVLRHLAASAQTLPMRLQSVLATADAAVMVTWAFGHSAADGTDDERSGCVEVLARMLARMHAPAPAGLARNPVRGCPLADRDAALRADLFVAEIDDEAAERALAVWDQGLAAPVWDGPELLLHGDPHPANVIVADDAGAPWLIDFGDTTPGDPASDLGALALFRPDALDPSGAVLAAYRADAAWDGAADDGTWDALIARARAWSVRMAVSLLTAYGRGEGLGGCAAEVLRRL